MPIEFEQLSEFFADEETFGQLCDIVVPDATRDSWAAFLARVVPSFPHTFSLSTVESETPQAIPQDTLSVVSLAGSDAGPWPGLELDLRGLSVRVHFFDPDWLELSVRRTKVDAGRYAALVELMCRMGDAMQRDVFITPESCDAEGVMVYEAAQRCFRRPRHGEGTDGVVRARVMGGLRVALDPIRAANPRERVGKSLVTQSLSDTVLRPVLERIEAVSAAFPELTLQDELTIEDRRNLKRAWSLVASIVTPPPGSGAEQYRDAYVLDLIKLARQG